ncbi:MAG: TRAP transporter TatT component family protein [Candidatus Bipolaricaulota bacterium]|nr:TRAP transporter TatT component family protein [Candidatus Bipolaricaulota bacterium]
MRKLVLVGVCLLLFMGVTAVAQDEPVTMDLDTALSYYQNDSFVIEYSDAGKTQLLGIIDAFKAALGVTEDLDETSEDAVVAFDIDISLKDIVNKLSQAYYTLGNVFVDPSENEDIYLKGKNWGLKSLRMNPEFAELEKSRFDTAVAAETDAAALYWTNSNWLRVAQKNPLQAVVAGVTKRTGAIMDRLLDIAPNYLSGGVYRSYGAYYSGLPSMFGRDLGKALCYLCPVIEEPGYCAECSIAEHVPGTDAYFENRSFFVEFYLMPKKQWEDAARILQSILDDPIGEQYPFMNAYSQENVRELLAEVQENL